MAEETDFDLLFHYHRHSVSGGYLSFDVRGVIDPLTGVCTQNAQDLKAMQDYVDPDLGLARFVRVKYGDGHGWSARAGLREPKPLPLPSPWRDLGCMFLGLWAGIFLVYIVMRIRAYT